MKKYLLLLLTALIVCGMKPMDAKASKSASTAGISAQSRFAKSQKDTSEIDTFAQEYLEKMKGQLSNPEILGMTDKEFTGAALGGVFSTYLFDKEGNLISEDGLAYPVFYNDKMIAILETSYDSEVLTYTYTFGRSYADKLEQILITGNLDDTKGLIVGRIADKFFITDGVHVEIILECPANLFSEPDKISKEELMLICKKLPQVIDAQYTFIRKPDVDTNYEKNISQTKAKKLLKSYLKKKGEWKTGYSLVSKRGTTEKSFKIGEKKVYRFDLKTADGKKQGSSKQVQKYAVTYDGRNIYLYIPSNKKYVEQI